MYHALRAVDPRLERLTTHPTGAFDFEALARRFAHATRFVSIHGAGLANMLYMRPGSLVVELMPGSASASRGTYSLPEVYGKLDAEAVPLMLSLAKKLAAVKDAKHTVRVMLSRFVVRLVLLTLKPSLLQHDSARLVKALNAFLLAKGARKMAEHLTGKDAGELLRSGELRSAAKALSEIVQEPNFKAQGAKLKALAAKTVRAPHLLNGGSPHSVTDSWLDRYCC